MLAGASIGGGGGAVIGEQLAQFGAQVLDLEIARDGDEAALPQLVAVIYGNAGSCASVLCTSSEPSRQATCTVAEAYICCMCASMRTHHH